MTRQWNANLPTVPVDDKGNWLDWVGRNHTKWETIHQPFYAELVIDGMRTGRSSKKVILKDITYGKEHPMFIADLVRGIAEGHFRVEPRADGGRLIGWWTGSKRGANYGIKAVRQDV